MEEVIPLKRVEGVMSLCGRRPLLRMTGRLRKRAVPTKARDPMDVSLVYEVLPDQLLFTLHRLTRLPLWHF